jgi:hypothetical protein
VGADLLRTLFSNIGSNLSVLVVRVSITLVMTPLYLRVLGRYDYGVWEILYGVIGYMGSDIDIKPVGRYISKYSALDEMDGQACIFNRLPVYVLYRAIRIHPAAGKRVLLGDLVRA